MLSSKESSCKCAASLPAPAASAAALCHSVVQATHPHCENITIATAAKTAEKARYAPLKALLRPNKASAITNGKTTIPNRGAEVSAPQEVINKSDTAA